MGRDSPSREGAKRQRIDADARAQLHDFFVAKDWALNTNLPRGNVYTNSEIGIFAAELGLSRDQVRTQLANYKEARYGNSQIELLVNADELDEDLRLSLSMETNEFVTTTMQRLLDGDVSAGRDFSNMAKVLDAFPAAARGFVETLSRSPDHPGVDLLGEAVENFIDSAALMIPKKASGLPNAEVGFQRSILEHKGSIVSRWIELVDSDDVDLGRDKAGRLGQYLHTTIYQAWVRASAYAERPPVQIPGQVKLGKYARPVIYYVAGWTLYSASRALTISLQEREKCFQFVQRNNTTKEDAEKDKLPIDIVEKRSTRRAAKMYASKAYYNFICSVESIYLTNLNIRMIRAYADGDIMDVILGGILKNKHLESKFRSLCADGVGTKEQQQILKYLMERYANMRGTFFVKSIKNNNPKSSVDTLAERQATRSKVSNAVITAKAVAKVTEATLWSDAAKNVLEATKNS